MNLSTHDLSNKIKYLLDKSNTDNVPITVGDINLENAQKLVGNHENASAILLDVFNAESRKEAIQKAQEMARAMLAYGDSIKKVITITGLEEETILAIKKECDSKKKR